MINRGFLLLMLVIMLLSACSPISHLTVDLTVPSKEELPDAVQSMTLVNRAADKRFTDDPADTLQLRFYESQFVLDTMILDVPATDTLLKAMGNLLFESGRYDIVIPEDRFLMKDTLNICADTLAKMETVKLTGLYNTDAVLALDYFNTTVHTDFFKGTGWNAYSYESVLYYQAVMRIDYTALFRIYYRNDGLKMNSYFITDTLYWEDRNTDIKNLFRSFTKVKEALSETGIAAAVRLSQLIAPRWEPAERSFFSGGNEVLQSTVNLVMNNDWENALNVWMDTYKKTHSKPLKSKLEFNIALAHEMLGNLNEAIRWGIKSYEHTYRPVTYDYLNTLDNRKTLLLKTNVKK